MTGSDFTVLLGSVMLWNQRHFFFSLFRKQRSLAESLSLQQLLFPPQQLLLPAFPSGAGDALQGKGIVPVKRCVGLLLVKRFS
jgi:hypothetical protein